MCVTCDKVGFANMQWHNGVKYFLNELLHPYTRNNHQLFRGMLLKCGFRKSFIMNDFLQNPHFRHVCTILVLPLFLVFLKLFCRNLWKSGRKSRWLRLMCIHNSFINLKMRVNLNTCTYVEHITYVSGPQEPGDALSTRFWQKR